MLGTFDNDQPKIEIEVKGINGSPKKVIALIDSDLMVTSPYLILKLFLSDLY